jgi:hypothetical protein
MKKSIILLSLIVNITLLYPQSNQISDTGWGVYAD